MCDERLRTKIVADGYPQEVAEAWGRDELLATYSEVIVAGVKPKSALVSADQELERQRLAFDIKKLEHEAQQEQQRIDLERRRLEEDHRRNEQEQQRMEQEQWKIDLERQRLELENKKAEKEREVKESRKRRGG